MTRETKPTPVMHDFSHREAAPAPALKTIEEFAALKQTPVWLFAAMKACHQFGIGQQLTEAAYDAACDVAANLKMIPG